MDISTYASSNIGFGSNILRANVNGEANVAIGSDLLVSSDGFSNTAIGLQTLYSNTSGSQNNGIGTAAMYSGTNHNFNNAMGTNALYSNQTGLNNVAIGNFAAASLFNTTGNVALGGSTLISMTAGTQTTAIGSQALRESTGVVASFGTITPGSGYTDGTYSAVELEINYTRIFSTPAASVIPTADITVSGGAVTAVTLVYGGRGIRPGTICTIKADTAPAGLLTGSGFSVPVAVLNFGTQNTALGFNSGRLCVTGSRNVFLGFDAGRNENGNDKLYISNNQTADPLIKGEFDNTGGLQGLVRINGRFEIAQAYVPTSATDPGTPGQLAFDTNYMYYCTAINTWKRVAIATW